MPANDLDLSTGLHMQVRRYRGRCPLAFVLATSMQALLPSIRRNVRAQNPNSVSFL